MARRKFSYATHSTLLTTMGSLPEGLMCAYCDEEEAGYIPDGCCGPICGTCLDLGIDHGFEVVYNLRLQRWFRATIGWLSAWSPTRVLAPPEVVLHDPSLALHISQFLVQVTDGLEFWDVTGAPTPLTVEPVPNID